MKRYLRSASALVTSALLLSAGTVEARLGIFDLGYGTKSKGMGGTAVANPQDSMVGATNPAGLVEVGSRLDGALQFLIPPRVYSHSNAIVGIQQQPAQQTLRGYPKLKVIPAFGWNKMVDGCRAVGFTVYSTGGQTYYKRGNPVTAGGNAALLSEKAGVELRTILTSFNFSQKLDPCHSIGASLIIGLQHLRVRGFYAFDSATSSLYPGSVTQSYDWAWGAGARVGYLGKIYDGLTIGASYTTQMAFQRMKQYKGLLPQAGRLDVPAVLSLGFAYELSPCSTFAFEYQRVFYRDLNTWHHSFNRYVNAGGAYLLGEKEGPGFGWNNHDIYKFGVDYDWDPCLKLRTGFTYSSRLYGDDQLDVNVLTQNMGRYHWSAGATWQMSPCEELDFSYFYMFRVRRSGDSQLVGVGGTGGPPLSLGRLSQRMYQHSFELNYGRRF